MPTRTIPSWALHLCIACQSMCCKRCEAKTVAENCWLHCRYRHIHCSLQLSACAPGIDLLQGEAAWLETQHSLVRICRCSMSLRCSGELSSLHLCPLCRHLMASQHSSRMRIRLDIGSTLGSDAALRNDAWAGYGGGTLYTRAKTLPPQLLCRNIGLGLSVCA